MTAIEKLQKMAEVYAVHHRQVTEECRTMAKAGELMAKWEETRLVDAIHCEAKSRTCRELNS